MPLTCQIPDDIDMLTLNLHFIMNLIIIYISVYYIDDTYNKQLFYDFWLDR